MKNRKMFLQVLLPMALVLSLILSVSVVGASGVGLLPDKRPVDYSAADSWGDVSAMALNTPQGNVTPMVAAGNDRIVGLKSDGTLVAVGLSSFICGVGSGGSVELLSGGHSSPLYVSDWTDIIQVAAGHARTVCLKADGTVVTVGFEANEHWYSGFESWTDILQVAEGDHHIVGLKADSTVVAVGINDYGQCDVGGWTDITQVAAGEYHTVGLKSDGTVVTVGWNEYGQCDLGDWRDIVQVATGGGDHTVGLKSDGTVVAAGYNCHGQCHVGDWTDIIQVASRYIHTVGLKSDGTVVAAGEEKTWACNVDDWTDIVQVAAGSSSTIGLKTDGTVVATGSELDYNFQPVESAALARVVEWNLGVTRYDLTISSTAGGLVTMPGEGVYTYSPRTIVNLVAEPEEGYRFVRWTGDVRTIGSITADATTITMHGAYSVTANFRARVNWALIGGAIAAVIAAGLVIFFMRRKRRASTGGH
jgi:alpha-tubulin suppressor-like RCC1 family protein